MSRVAGNFRPRAPLFKKRTRDNTEVSPWRLPQEIAERSDPTGRAWKIRRQGSADTHSEKNSAAARSNMKRGIPPFILLIVASLGGHAAQAPDGAAGFSLERSPGSIPRLYHN